MVQWSIDPRGDACTAIHAGARVELTSEECGCLRILIAARRSDDPDQPSQWQGYVRSVDLLPPKYRRGSGNTSIQARAMVRRLRFALSSIGLEDVIAEHEHFGYRLQVVPEIPRG